MDLITGVIICKNEEDNIEEAIKSILWCDEVIIVDAFSTDKTVEIIKKQPVKLLQNEWKGFADQRKYVLSKVKTEWVLSIDADERCTKELEKEIRQKISQKDLKEDGFFIPRKSYFLNKWIKHGGWYPNYQMRVFRKSSAEVSDRKVHESYTVNGFTGKFKNDLLHYTVTSLSEYVTRINKYSDLSAIEKLNKKKIGFFDILILPRIAFFKQFIIKGNFLDGTEGLMVSKFHMITKLLNYMKIRELQNMTESMNRSTPE
ncbi:MAG TPA: glycosyltransferase family 2 protein [Ignavibacteria bacterium]|nr:glycosyltransferase family 2 protein [Ignavibacteria bacterium]HMR40548.1 glycosyltransferase family 2 protein [Ignavibacteria bacterium]